jgi:hypothetical protein
MILAWLAGFGPLPAEPNARMHLERLRGAVKAAYFCQSTGLNTPRLFAETDTRRPFGYFRRALREGALPPLYMGEHRRSSMDILCNSVMQAA